MVHSIQDAEERAQETDGFQAQIEDSQLQTAEDETGTIEPLEADNNELQCEVCDKCGTEISRLLLMLTCATCLGLMQA